MSKSPKKSKSLTRAGNRPATISAQQTIPYVRMLPDGICQLPGGVYTKTLEYEDINYSVASAEDQTAIFGGWSSWLNYFDSSLPFQLSFVNRRSRSGSRYKVNISEADDRFNSVRTEYTGMLKNQIAKSNNGIERAKYVTFCIPAENVAAARPRLERVEADVIGNFKRLGVQSQPLDGRERLALLHGQLHPGSREPFRFKWADIAHTGMGTKDFIVPDSFDFRQSRSFRVGQTWGAASYLQIMASELSDKLLLEILELDAELTVTMHIQTVDQVKAIKTVKGKISDIDKMKVEEQRKATRAGYDPDILPPDLVTFSKDAAELLADLQSRNERMFLLTFLIVNTAPTRERLENDIFTVNGIAQKYNCAVKRLDWQQEQGYMSSLALGYNGIEIQRGMTTSSTAIFVPFMTRELRMDGPSLYYGMNALSHNVIMESREERLNKARERLAKQKPPKKPGPIKRIARIAGHETHAFLHGKVYQEERDNVGVEGGHFVERSGEAALHYGRHKVRRAIREHPAKAAARAESRYIKATADYHSRKFAQEQPEAQSAAARLWHRHKLKREYQRKARETAKQTAKAAEQTASAMERFVREAAAFVKRHPVGTLLALGCLLVVLTLQSCMSSMVSVGNSTLAAIAASTYKAEDADMLGAEAAYCALEDDLQRYLDTYTRTHDYDEYHFDLDTIEHDPYVLISMISALHEGAWTLDEVRGTLQDLFDRQYILTEDVVVEVRYRTVTRTDSEGNDYEVEVPYNYYICYVTLENFNLSHVPVYMMSEEQLSMYALYMSTLGNRPDLFPSSGYIGKYITNRPPEHEVPESYLDDETFAAILKEAEKYLDFPYVWGGSSPSTSFDCSGFVGYVYNQCGWSFGRLGAQGLYNICSRTSSPRPGDLVFFVGTYDTAGISHVGIYVGDGWMLHCGDPISYANLNSSYWQSHLYAYGRLP